MKDKQTFGKYVSMARKEAELSQKQLAEMIKRDDGESISPQYLNDIEKDRRSPSSDHIIDQFAKHLDLSKDYLYYLVGNLPDDIREKNLNESEVGKVFKAFRKD